MGRPSVADARRRQVLDAAIRCLSANGLAATTLDGIAAAAGMARGHVRHFAGNRDEILADAATLLYFGVIPDPDTRARRGGSFLPAEANSPAAALDYLFGGFADPGPESVAALAFVEAAHTNERIREVVVDAYRSAEVELQGVIAAAAPHALPHELVSAAYGVMTIALGHAFMTDIEASDERTALARRHAETLIETVISRS